MSAALDGLYDVVRHGNGETNLRGYDGADAWQTQNFCPTEICAIEPNEEIAAELDTVWQSTTNDTIDVATDLGGFQIVGAKTRKPARRVSISAGPPCRTGRRPGLTIHQVSIGMTMTEQTTASQATGSAGRNRWISPEPIRYPDPDIITQPCLVTRSNLDQK